MTYDLDHADYNQITWLYDLRVTSIFADDISYEEIYTLNSIDTTQPLQQHINSIQSV